MAIVSLSNSAGALPCLFSSWHFFFFVLLGDISRFMQYVQLGGDGKDIDNINCFIKTVR